MLPCVQDLFSLLPSVHATVFLYVEVPYTILSLLGHQNPGVRPDFTAKNVSVGLYGLKLNWPSAD
jgi:hypothetical protein